MLEPAQVRTNRDLYVFVSGLVEKHRNTQGSLEAYLKALWRNANAFKGVASLTPESFSNLLSRSFDGRDLAQKSNPGWQYSYERRPRNFTGYLRWETTIHRQIVDLHEMEKAGIFTNELRYYGVDAPRGGRWYNLDPVTYLECAVAGTFDGWREGDSTGRIFVPGLVAVLNENGQITSANPREIQAETFMIESVSWDVFADFLESGQWYE